MTQSHKPIIWGLFAAGGTVAAFVVPALILITCLAVPLGLLPSDVLSYDNLHDLLRHPFSKLVAFGVLFVIVWHAAHRMRITAHDLGVRSDALVMLICYGVAAFGTVLAALGLMRI